MPNSTIPAFAATDPECLTQMHRVCCSATSCAITGCVTVAAFVLTVWPQAAIARAGGRACTGGPAPDTHQWGLWGITTGRSTTTACKYPLYHGTFALFALAAFRVDRPLRLARVEEPEHGSRMLQCRHCRASTAVSDCRGCGRLRIPDDSLNKQPRCSQPNDGARLAPDSRLKALLGTGCKLHHESWNRFVRS